MTGTKYIQVQTPGYNHPEIGSMRKDIDRLCAQAKNSSSNSVWTNYNTSSAAKAANTMTTLYGVAALVTSTAAVLTPLAALIKGSGSSHNNNNNNSVVDNGKKQTNADVDALNQAISDCKKNGQVDALKQMIEDKQNTYDTNEAKIKTMLDGVSKDKDAKETAFNTKNDEVTKENKVLDKDIQDEKNAKSTFDQAGKDYSSAEKASKKADDDFTTIETQYNAADEKGKAQLQTQYNTAKTAKENAKIAMDKALETKNQKEQEYKDAQKARADQKEFCGQLAEELKTAKAKFDNAKTAYELKQKEQSALQTQNGQLKSAIEAAQAALPEYAKNETKNEKDDTKEDKPLTDEQKETMKNVGISTAMAFSFIR